MSKVSLRSVRDVAALRSYVREVGCAEYLYFWGHRSPADSVSKACLSQWYPSPFRVNGVEYPTAEHFMMAAKARLFGDVAAAERIVEALEPGKAKALGRGVAGFDQTEWERSRWGIVVAGNVAKFDQNPEIGGFLQATVGKVLVEASPHDLIWGIGVAEAEARQLPVESWPGQNLLGFALMEARDQLVGLVPRADA